MVELIDIESYYKEYNVNLNFNEILYKSDFPEIEDFYQPFCKQNGISEKQRLFYHFVHYYKNHNKKYFYCDKKEKVYIKVNNGLANRLRTLGSFYNFCQHYNKYLYVCWQQGPGWGTESFLDLFENINDVNFISFEEYEDVKKHHVNLDDLVTKNIQNPSYYLFNTSNSEVLELIKNQTFCYDGESALEYFLKIKTNEEFLKKIIPKKHIEYKIKNIVDSFDKNIVGVHIRRGDAWESPWKDFFKLSDDDFFIKEIEKEIKENPDVNFYLSTDCEKIQNKFIDIFKNRIKFYKKRFAESYDHEKPKYEQESAVVDLFCLSNTNKIIGSYWSSFSNLAADLQKKPISYTTTKPSVKFEQKDNISVVCAVKNRTASLLLSLRSWLATPQINNIIIVDWSSDVPVEKEIENNSKIKIIRIENEKYFNISKAFNIGFRQAPEGMILKMDADYILNPYFNFFEIYSLSENEFLTGSYKDEDLENYNGFISFLNGLLFINKKDFLSVGGYNEDFNSYGYDDCDLYNRLESRGFIHKYLNHKNMSVFHTPHSDDIRCVNYENKNIYESLLQNYNLSQTKK